MAWLGLWGQIEIRSHLSGQATRDFCCMYFPTRRKSSAGNPVFCKFCVYFPSRMRGTCVSVASVLLGMRATPGYGAWKLYIRSGQHTCTARYGRMNSVVNARELRARCEGTRTYRNKRFHDIGKQCISIGKSKWFPDIAKKIMDLVMSEIIYWYWNLFSDIGNYFPRS